MARKPKASKEDSLDNDISLFNVLEALDNKDYGYYDRLTPEQRTKIVPYTLIQWLSTVQANTVMQTYYLQSVEYHANKYLFDNNIAAKSKDNGKLQWLMLCAASPGKGKQYHKWIPKISEKVSLLKENAKISDVAEYYQKIYPKISTSDIESVASDFVARQRKKVILGKMYPSLKIDEIELLSTLVSDDDLAKYERDSGN